MNLKQANVACFGLALLGVGLHILCIASPYYASANFAELKSKVSTVNRSQEEIALINSYDYEVHLGFYKVCFEGGVADKIKMGCITIGGKNDPSGKQIQAPSWLNGPQALGIIGTIISGVGVIGLAISTFKESKGDRRRILPRFLWGNFSSSALMWLIADFIFISRSEDAVFAAVPPDSLPDDVLQALKQLFHLDWCVYVDTMLASVFLLAGVGLQCYAGRLVDKEINSGAGLV